jgi:anaerobic magnesium-protoporphyrin IX monomethyl ester cyclase
MKVLLLIPPHIPSYFNAGHHLPLFQVGAFLRMRNPEWEIQCWDGAALNAGWKEVCDQLVRGHDVIGIMNDFDSVDTLPRTLEYIAELNPSAKTFTFGRLSKQIPGFFRRFNLDAVIESGDYEPGVQSYLSFLCNPTKADDSPGTWIRAKGSVQTTRPGIFLEPELWVFPDVREIPYPEYKRMYQNDLNKYCGIPNCFELVAPVARGCPINCGYCDVPTMQGLMDRRVSAESALDYIAEALQLRDFDYVSFYAPTFTLRRNWVIQLCDAVVKRNMRFLWKCVTTLSHLDDALLNRMAGAGCVRVSVGLETLDPGAASALPMLKRNVERDFDRIAASCRKANIELNCFVILGLPGDSVEGVEYTIRRVLENGARVRPTIYTPYHEMHAEMTLEEVGRYNRQLFTPKIMSNEKSYSCYQLLYANRSDRATPLAQTIAGAMKRAI